MATPREYDEAFNTSYPSARSVRQRRRWSGVLSPITRIQGFPAFMPVPPHLLLRIRVKVYCRLSRSTQDAEPRPYKGAWTLTRTSPWHSRHKGRSLFSQVRCVLERKGCGKWGCRGLRPLPGRGVSPHLPLFSAEFSPGYLERVRR